MRKRRWVLFSVESVKRSSNNGNNNSNNKRVKRAFFFVPSSFFLDDSVHTIEFPSSFLFPVGAHFVCLFLRRRRRHRGLCRLPRPRLSLHFADCVTRHHLAPTLNFLAFLRLKACTALLFWNSGWNPQICFCPWLNIIFTYMDMLHGYLSIIEIANSIHQ